MFPIFRRLLRLLRQCVPCLLATVLTVSLLLPKYLLPDGLPHNTGQNQNWTKHDLHYLTTKEKLLCNVKNNTSEGEIHLKREHHYTDYDLNFAFPEVKVGGHWSPSNCKPVQKLAVIIPFRDPYGDRHKNLMVLIHQLHVLLQHQQLGYHIFVVQQNGTEGYFNKGVLMNLGFKHSIKTTQATCIVFHDVDVVPVDDRNSYMCGSAPRHLSENINNATGLGFQRATGGALCLSPINFTTVNGFSNRFWGWGNEDDDLHFRFVYHKLKLAHADLSTGRYLHLHHKRNYKHQRPKDSQQFHLYDGLNSLDSVQYKLLEDKPHKAYTWLNYHLMQPLPQTTAKIK